MPESGPRRGHLPLSLHGPDSILQLPTAYVPSRGTGQTTGVCFHGGCVFHTLPLLLITRPQLFCFFSPLPRGVFHACVGWVSRTTSRVLFPASCAELQGSIFQLMSRSSEPKTNNGVKTILLYHHPLTEQSALSSAWEQFLEALVRFSSSRFGGVLLVMTMPYIGFSG